MKFKKLALALVAVLGASTLAACGSDNTKVNFTEYWHTNWVAPEYLDETLTYDVSYEGKAGLSSNYTLAYTNGSYETKLKTVQDYYVQTSDLNITVTYSLSDGQTASFIDSVSTEVHFKKAENALRPMYSKKTVVSRSPANVTASEIKECYSAYDYTVETNYKEGSSATTVSTYRYTDTDTLPKDKKIGDVKSKTTVPFSYASEDYVYLDNEQLLTALRVVSADTSSGSFDVFNPFIKQMQTIGFSFGSSTGGTFNHTLNGGELSNKSISYRSVSLTIDAENPGGTQTAWIASVRDAANNTNRNVMLRLETPIAYNLGSLVYTLKNATYNNQVN